LKKQDVGKYIAIVGVLLLFTLPLGVVNTFYSIFLLFNEVQINGTGDPKLMAGGLSSALVSTVQGLILCVPGLFLLLISITALRYRPKWAY
jgi:biopolymer transport protein ExbB